LADQNFRVKRGLEVGIGATVLVAQSSGNIGINSTAPEEILTVYKEGVAALFRGDNYAITALTSTPRLRFGTDTSYAGYMEIGTWNSVNNLDTKNRDFKLFSTAVDPILYAQEDTGNLGIGTDNPGYKLEVAGDIKLADNGTLWFDDTSGNIEKIVNLGGSLDYYSDVSHRFFESNTNAERATFDVNNPSGRLYFDGDSNTYFTRQATDCHVFVNAGNESLRINASGNVGIGTDNPTATLDVIGTVKLDGLVFGVGTTVTSIDTDLTSVSANDDTLASAKAIKDYVVNLVTAQDLDFADGIGGTGAVDLDSQSLTIAGTSNEIETSASGQTLTIGLPDNVTIGQDLTVTRDVQINRNLNVDGNITIGGTSATLFTQTLTVSDADLILGFRTDAFGNDISNDTTANHGGIAIASTEGTPLVTIVNPGAGETLPATYKKIMWFKSGSFSGLGTDAWLSNYAVGIGSIQVPNGVRLAAGDVHITENDISKVRDINASGIITASQGISVGSGNTVINSSGNVYFDGTPTITNQDRGIYWTAYDKEGTSNLTDLAHIRHTTNTGGLGGSVLEIKSHNDAEDGVNFVVSSNASGVRINGNAVWHEGNDGAGTGLDADTLDTLEATSFLRSDVADTGTGLITLTNGLNVTGGSVGIGTDNPATALEIYTADPILTIRDTSTSIGNANATLRLAETNGSGTLDNYWDIVADTTAGNWGFTVKEGTTTRLAIQPATGNVGIGTITPTAKLDVRGDTKILGGRLTVSNSQTTANYGYINHWDNFHSIILRGYSSNTAGAPVEANEMSFVEYGGIWNFYKTTPSADNKIVVKFREDTGNSWINVGGSLGIGTDNPSTKLHINSGGANDCLRLESTDTAVNLLMLDDTTSTATNGALVISRTGDDTKFYSGALESFRINGSNQNVLISTATDTGTSNQKLQVSGGAYVSGNLGVGVTNPQDELHLGASSNVGIRLQDTSPGGGSYAAISYNDNGSGTNILDLSADGGNTGTNTEIRFSIDGNDVSRYAVGGELLVGAATTTGTASQKLQVTGGAYVSGNLGVGATNPGEKLDVRGNLRVGGADAGPNYIAFRGTTGDQPGNYNHGYIGERIYNATEQSELLIVKGNDTPSTGGGVDRVRIAAGEFRVDTYNSSSGASGTFEQVATNSNLSNRFVVTSDGNVGIGTDVPSVKFDVNGDARFRGKILDSANSEGLTNYVLASNGSSGNVEWKAVTAVGAVNGIDITNDTANTARYLTYATGTGNQTGLGITDSALVFNPSTTRLGIGTDNPGSTLAVGGTITELYDGTYWNIVSQADIGSDPDQIPLNQYLGQLAFLDDFSPNGLRREGGSSDDVVVGAGGSVGIGTTNPTEELHVLGAVVVSSDTATTGSDYSTLTIGERPAGDGYASLEFKYNTDAFSGKIDGTSAGINIWGNKNSITGDRFVWNGASTTEYVALRPRGQDVLHAQHGGINGRVGINITAPEAALDIKTGYGTSYTGTFTAPYNYTPTTSEIKIGSVKGASAQAGDYVGLRFSVIGNNSGNANAGIFAVREQAEGNGKTSLAFATRNWGASYNLTEKVRITSDGNLGVGVTNPQYTLDFGKTSASTIRLISENNGTAIRVGAGGIGNDVTLLRVDGRDINYDGESDSSSYGFSLKYLGSGGGNGNAFAIFSDNQTGSQTEAFTMLQDGNVGINSTTPTEKLDVVGTVKATDFNTTSDQNLKTNIQTIENPLDKIVQIRGVNFEWKENNKPSAGVIAQEVEKVLPQLVNGEDTKTVNYNGLIGLLIEAVKAQQEEINELKKRLG